MIDWFVWLVPIAVLPIALLLVFVGCALDRSGIPPPIVALLLNDDFQTDIDNIEVTFQYALSSGESPSNLRAIHSLSGANLAEGTFIDKSSELSLLDEPEGNLSCTCLITKKTFEKVTVSLSQPYSGDAENSALSAFDLVRDGEGFKLGVLGIEYTGGWS